MQPEDVGRLVEPGDPRVSPDGRQVAYVVQSVDLSENVYRSAVWVGPADGSAAPVAVTSGEHRDARPRWSPDGTALAFVSHRAGPGKGSEIRVLAVGAGGAAGEARRLAGWPEEVEDLAWSPDGTHLACTVRIRDEARYGPERDADRPPRRLDRLSFRDDGVGWTVDRPRHLFVVDVLSGTTRQLTDGDVDDAGAAWSPDGRWLAFASGRTDTWDVDLRVDLHVVPADGSAPPRAVTSCGRSHSGPSWSPDGRSVACVHGDRRDLPRNGQIVVVDVEGGEERELTTALDRNCAPFLIAAREPVWDEGGDELWFQAEHHGAVHLHRVPAAGGEVATALDGDRQVTGFDRAGGTLAVATATATTFPQLAVVDEGGGGAERVLAAPAVPFPVQEPERFTATSSDGAEVEAWLVRPLGEPSGATLLNIHGGPYSQYGYRLFDEFQVQAGAGYAVLYANPRGSSGYGEAWGRAIRSPLADHDPGTGWGGIDADDCLAVVDEAARRFPDVVDGDRVGVLGGSYGGFMTSWLIGHTDRFAAACSERAVNNLLTMVHTSDIGYWFNGGYIGVSHLDDPSENIRQSPVTYADAITTPLLILHSEGDLRCPIEQAEDLFVRLKLRDREVELVRFPGEGHELTRSGSPKHRLQRFELLLEFFGRYLGETRRNVRTAPVGGSATKPW